MDRLSLQDALPPHDLEATGVIERLPATQVTVTPYDINEAVPEELRKAIEATVRIPFFAPASTPGELITTTLGARHNHFRSGDISDRSEFRDSSGLIWRVFDRKGAGKLVNNHGQLEVAAWEPNGQGLMRPGDHRSDRRNSEKYRRAGIRTHLVVACYEIHELLYEKDGVTTMVSVADLRNMGVIGPDDRFVAQERAYGVKTRIRDVVECKDKVQQRAMVFDALAFMRRQLGQPRLSLSDYVSSIAEILGRSIGIIHGHFKEEHGFLNSHNIGLDGGIFDLDSPRPLSKWRIRQRGQRFDDTNTALLALETYIKIVSSICSDLNLPPVEPEWLNTFRTRYESASGVRLLSNR